MEEEEAAVPDEKRCANPACPDPSSTSRLQCLPAGLSGGCGWGERSTFIARRSCVLGGRAWMLQRKRGESGLLPVKAKHWVGSMKTLAERAPR